MARPAISADARALCGGPGGRRRSGDAAYERIISAHLAGSCLITGDWEAFTTRADDFIARCESGEASHREAYVRFLRAAVSAARGDRDRATADTRRALDQARQQDSPQDLLPALGGAILILEDSPSWSESGALATELLELAQRFPHEAVWALSLGYLFSRSAMSEAKPLRRLLDRAPETPWKPLAYACVGGDFATAADLFAEAGSPTWEARLRLRAAEDLAAAGRLDESRVQAQRALAFHRQVGASRYIELERRVLEGAS